MRSRLRCRLLLTSLLWLNAISSIAEDKLPKIQLYTVNYGDFHYSLNGRDYEHWREDIGGTATDIVKKIMDESDLEYRMRLRVWSVSYGRTLDRPNYGVFSTARTASREDKFHWIGPVGQYNWILLAKSGNNLNISRLEDIRGLRIGGYEGDAATTFLQEQGFEVSTLPDEPLNAQRLAQNLIDVWITSDINGYKVAEDTGYPDVEEAFRIKSVGLYLAMNPDTDPHILAKLDQAYQSLLDRGEIQFD